MKVIVYRPKDGFLCEENGSSSPTSYRALSYSTAMLAGAVRAAGHHVEVVDGGAEGWEPEEAAGIMAGRSFDVLMVTVNTFAAGLALKGIDELKRAKNVRVIAFVTHMLGPAVLRSYPFLDAVVRREWRAAAPDLLAAFSADQPLNSVDGIYFLDAEGQLVETPARPFLPLDASPPPAFDLFPMRKYSAYTMIFSEGCDYHCVYCFFRYPGKWHGRDIKRCVDELAQMRSYANRLVFSMDDELTLDPAYTKDLCRAIIARRLDLMLSANTRADRDDDELFALMSRAGFFQLGFGVESGNQRILDKNATKKNLEQVKATYALLERHRIAAKTYFMIGLLHDTRDTIAETFRFVSERLKPYDTSFDVVVPYPHTPMYTYLKRQGWIEDLTVENLTWIYYTIYGCKQLADCPMEKPDWRIGDIGFEELYAMERDWYAKVPHGGYARKLALWLRNPNFLKRLLRLLVSEPAFVTAIGRQIVAQMARRS
jgi:radical SAM superfamily enzyme YgiQ (UPF0313 family)